MDKLRTTDIFKSSYGVGHHWRPGYYFPSHENEPNMARKLPRNLDKSCEISSQKHFATTNQTYHNVKENKSPLRNDFLHKPAPSSRDVNYLKDSRFVSNRRPWRRSLSPRNQKSETCEEFSFHKPLSEPRDILGIKNFLLHEYDVHEFNKEGLSDKIEDKLGIESIGPMDSELLRNLDPYLTTNLKTHRTWRPEELKGYPKKDIMTHWETLNCPKAHGYGLKINPLPTDSAPRQLYPMQDELIFKDHTTNRRVPPVPVNVPHTGLKSLYMDSYEGASSGLAKMDRVCPIDPPYVIADPGTNISMTVPLMYKSEYQSYGKCHRNIL